MSKEATIANVSVHQKESPSVSYPRPKWWVPWIRGPLVVLGVALAPLIFPLKLILGYLDNHMARNLEEQFARDVKLALSFLFTQYGGRIVPNSGVPFPPGFDYAYVTVEAGNLHLRFSRGRGELAVLVAPAFAPTDWHDLSLVLEEIPAQGERAPRVFRDLWEVSSVLYPHFQVLEARFCAAMSYASVDPIISHWASTNGLHVCMKYRDEDVRSMEIRGSNALKCQLWIDPPDESGNIQVHIWDYDKRSEVYRVEVGKLAECLDNAHSSATVWLITNDR